MFSGCFVVTSATRPRVLILTNMPLSVNDFEGQDALFDKRDEKPVPSELSRATLRLQFPPSYVVVGAYRLLTDKTLLKPTWDKCKHAARRGAIVGGIWVSVL